MKKHLLKSTLLTVIMVMSAMSAWAYTPSLTAEYAVPGYKYKAFYDISNDNVGDMCPAYANNTLSYRGSGYGLYNYGAGDRAADITLSVKSTDLLLLEFKDTQGRSVTINSVSSCTKNGTFTSGDIIAWDVNADATTVNVSVGRGGCIIAILVMEKDPDAATADYTINYVLGEDVIKTTTGNVAVGTPVNTDASFFVDYVKYFRADGEEESVTIATSGNEFTVSVRQAEIYSYSLLSSLGSTITIGSDFEGETNKVGYPRYQLQGTDLYEASANSMEYRLPIVLTENNVSATVTYTQKYENVVFCAEAETLDGVSVTSTGNISVRASNALAAITSQDVTITTLPIGKYKIHAGIFTSKSNYSDFTVNFGIGSRVFAAAFVGVNLNEVASDEYVLASETDIKYLASSSADTQFDYIWIEKTGDPTQEELAAAGQAEALAAAKTALQNAIDAVSAYGFADLNDAITTAQAAVNNQAATLETLTNASTAFDTTVKAYLRGVLTEAITFVESLNEEDLAQFVTNAKAALNNNDATMQELASAMFAMLNNSQPSVRSLLEKAVELANTIGVNTTAAQELLEKDNPEATTLEMYPVIVALVQPTIEETHKALNTLQGFLATFDSEAAAALNGVFSQLQTDIANKAVDAIKTDIEALMTDGQPYLLSGLGKLSGYADIINNEDITTDVSAILAAAQTGSFAALYAAIKKFETDFLAAAPGFVQQVKYAAALAYEGGKTKGYDQLQTAISNAETAIAAEDKTVVTVGLAIRNLILALQDFEQANAPVYIVNAEFKPDANPIGWAPAFSDGFRDIGMGLIGYYKVRNEFGAATVDAKHLATEFAAGFECRWAGSFSSYTQTTATLPAGEYVLVYDVENVNAATSNLSYNNLFKVTVGENIIVDESTEWMKGKSEWTTHSIFFTLDNDAPITISLGYGTGSNDIPLQQTPALYVSHLRLLDALTAAQELLADEIVAANALKTETRTAGLEDFNSAIQTAVAAGTTATEANEINDALAALKVAETEFLTANLPVAEGTYYVYNPLTEKFLARGNAWGTSAVVGDYGVAIEVACTDLPNDKYTLTGFDNTTTYGDDAWMYADAGGDRARSYIIAQVEGGFTMTNTKNNQLVYVYLKEDENKYRVAGNAIKGDNYTDDAQTVWLFITPEEYNTMIADRAVAQKAAVFAAAGIEEDATTEVAEAIEVSFKSGHAWTQTVVRQQDNQPQTNDYGTEMWQATGNYSQTISELPSGLYKISIQAYYRCGGIQECINRYETGFNTVLAYLEANGSKVQVKSWVEDKGEDDTPDTMAEAAAKFDEGKYTAETFAYVAEDGLLNLKVDNPAFIGGGWFIVDNVKYAKVERIMGDANQDGEVTTGDAVAAVSFALEEIEPTPAQFKAADINNSEDITVSDVVAIVDIALAAEPEQGGSNPARLFADNSYLTLSGKEIGLVNTTAFVGFQMDVTLNNGAVLNGVTLSERAAGLTLRYNRVGQNTWRIIALSLNREAIDGDAGALLSLDITGNSNVNISNVEFADAAARAYTLGLNGTTAIQSSMVNGQPSMVYTVGGARSNTLQKGVSVVRTNNGQVRKVLVK